MTRIAIPELIGTIRSCGQCFKPLDVKMADNTTKKYYKISEVSEIVGLPMSTLRFWESQFTAINPKRNDRGTRFYTPRDIEVIRMIAFLVKTKGMKLDAAQEEIKRNRDGVAKRFEAIDSLKKVRDELQLMIDALHKFR